MNDPTRLLEQAGTSAVSRELLEALSPPTAPPPAVHAALSQSLSSMVAASGAKAAATATLWLKLSIASFALLGVGGAYWWYHHRLPEPRPTAHVASPPAKTLLPAVTPTASLEPAASTSAAAAASVTAPERVKPASSSRDTLAEEEALLESARQSMARDPAHALSLLQRHRAQFPTGQLAAERMYLSVDCLLRLGNRSAAERETSVLTKYYPSSAYARRAPMLLASPKR